MFIENQDGFESIQKSDHSKNWHLNPDNMAKIEKVLQASKTGTGLTDYVKTEEVKKAFQSKFTTDDLEFEKEREIRDIKNKVMQNQKNGMRTAQQVYGFIHPDEITIQDYKFSLATNKQDEEAITAGNNQE